MIPTKEDITYLNGLMTSYQACQQEDDSDEIANLIINRLAKINGTNTRKLLEYIEDEFNDRLEAMRHVAKVFPDMDLMERRKFVEQLPKFSKDTK